MSRVTVVTEGTGSAWQSAVQSPRCLHALGQRVRYGYAHGIDFHDCESVQQWIATQTVMRVVLNSDERYNEVETRGNNDVQGYGLRGRRGVARMRGRGPL